MSGLHSLLSASRANRWIACSGSVALEEQLLPDAGSEYAEEGTKAHALGEAILNKQPIPHVGEEMTKFVDEYVNYVCKRESEFNGNVERFIEKHLDLSAYVPGASGTADALLVGSDRAVLIDLKYGLGVRVDVSDNPQLMLYALSVVEALPQIKRIEAVIHQPRLNSVSEAEYTSEELKKWGNEVIKPAVRRVFRKPELTPGKHCQFCRAKARCPALAELAKQEAIEEFGVDNKLKPLDNGQISELLKQAKQLELFLKALKDEAERQLLEGHHIPSFKLVEGRGQRAWRSENAATSALIEAIGEDRAVVRKPLSPAQAEAVLGKKHPVLELHAFRREGKPTVVPETDRRPALVLSAAADFATVKQENSND